MARILYCDLLCGASGDMLLSSLLDLGVPVDYLQSQLSRMSIPGLKVSVEKVDKNGITCSHLVLGWDPPGEYRHLHDILDIIRNAGYGSAIYEKCEKVLHTLGKAESEVHGIDIEEVHFHEIGAVDTIIDIAGFVLAVDYLGVEAVYFSDFTDGRGTVSTEHGVMPIPVPATAKMIQSFRFRQLDITSELLTPTGCAVLVALGKQKTMMPFGTVVRVGYGCGTKEFEKHPNVLRMSIVEEEPEMINLTESERICVLETDMDHISGEIMAHVAGLLMEQGALDVCWIPLYMKKGRPAYRLSVSTQVADYKRITDLIITHTHTLGVRYQIVPRIVASRKVETISLLDSAVKEKTCTYKGYTFSKLEYESLSALSREKSVPMVDLMEQYIKSKN